MLTTYTNKELLRNETNRATYEDSQRPNAVDDELENNMTGVGPATATVDRGAQGARGPAKREREEHAGQTGRDTNEAEAGPDPDARDAHGDSTTTHRARAPRLAACAAQRCGCA